MNIYLDIIGCTANQSDASIARHLIEQHPEYHLVKTSDDASIILLFTCTVISTTEQRMYSKIKKYLASDKTVLVTGCMAQIQKEEIKQIQKDIICIPPDKIHHLLSYLPKPSLTTDEKEKYEYKKRYCSLAAPIAISEGCNFSCSYCITTLARGALKSFPEKVIIRDIKNALSQGCREIQLTAQDTASYGKDTGSNLAKLLKNLSKIPGWYRFRVGMMNPALLLPYLDDLISAFLDEHIYKFLHIPIQSGDDEILALMQRSYTIEDVETIVNNFRKHIPNITIATDVIVGFPSETEKQYQQTRKILTILQPDIINITKFSARPYTKAKTMNQRIPTKIVKQRSKELTEFVSALSLEKNIAYIGNHTNILITEKGKNHSMIGRTDEYKPVVVFKPLNIGDIVHVEITDAKQTHLVGILK